MKKTIIALSTVAALFSGASHAAGQGSGTVTFTGSVIAAPCSIDPGSVDQTVDLGQINSSILKGTGTTPDGNGKSQPIPFKIQLTDCVTGTNNTLASATFTGDTGGATGSLATTGTGKGFSVKLYNNDQTSLNLGVESKTTDLVDGSVDMNYYAGLTGNGVAADIMPGDFSATAAFELTYK